MSKTDINLEELSLIMEYLKEFYGPFEDLFPFIDDLEEIFKKADLNKKTKEEFIKKLIQLLLFYNVTILKSGSASAIRHFFPPEISEGYLPYNFDQFVKALKKAFKFINIEIDIKEPKEGGDNKKSEDLQRKKHNNLYFYFKDYESILRFLLYWDNKWLPFPKLNKLRTFLSNPNIYLYFDRTFMEQFFGENGIIERNKLTITKFFGDIFELSNYTRHSIYKWRDESYFPINVVLDLYKSKYKNKIDRDFYKSITYIKIGRSQVVNKSLLDQMKSNYKGNLDSFFPSSDSMLGQILSPNPLKEEKGLNYLVEFESYLDDIPNLFLEDYRKEIESIKDKLEISEKKVSIKSLKLKNFKSYSNFTVRFQNGINILYGINGSGKTSILDGIFFALFLDDSWEEVRINNLFNLDLRFLNTHLIRVGEEECEVELELMVGEEEINIKRKLQKDGNHQLFINDENIFESIKQNVITKFKIELENEEKQEEYIVEMVDDKPKVFVIPNKYKFFTNGVIDEAINDILLSEKYFFDLDWIEGAEELRANLESVKFFDLKLEDSDRFVFELEESISIYFNLIFAELRLNYKKFGCLFGKNEIYSSLFQEFSHIGRNLYSSSSDLHDFILDKFGVNFIEDNLIPEELDKLQKTKTKRVEIINSVFEDEVNLTFGEDKRTIYEMYETDYNWETEVIKSFEEYFLEGMVGGKYAEKFKKYTNESELIKSKINFLEDTRDFLFKLFSRKINKKLIDLTTEFFSKEQFYSFLDDRGVPKINFYKKNVILPISCLSGGERSKLILILLGLLIKIANKNSFFLIDEPNELLDSNNVNNMKQLFSKLFQNRQIIISTFLDSYKSFRPALIFEILKDSTNISHIRQIFPKISEFKRITVTLTLKDINSINDLAFEYGPTPGSKINRIVEFFIGDVMKLEKVFNYMKEYSESIESKSKDKLVVDKSKNFTQTTVTLKKLHIGVVSDLANNFGMTLGDSINGILKIFFKDENYKKLLREELIRKKRIESAHSLGISEDDFKRMLEKWKRENLGL